MRTLARAAAVGAFVAAAALASPALAAPATELNISADGMFSAKNVLVYQVSGTTLYCRLVWGSAFVRLTVLTSATTKILKNHGATAAVGEIVAGDSVAIDGTLSQNATTLLIDASAITDSSLNQESKTILGSIKSVDSTAGSFVLPNKTFGNTTVMVGATTTITKGVRTITPAELLRGDKVLSASGTYDYTANTLAADTIKIYQDPSVFAPRNFQGTVRAISGTTLPTSLIVDTPAESYTVYLDSNAQVLSKNRAAVGLSRFAVGDMVRFYGAIRQDNLVNVDAEIIRDLMF